MNNGLSPGATEWLLAFADDEHIIGARHTSWIGLGPFLEEDLAFCSIAQDELGHAIALYELLGVDVDRFALLREPSEYRSAWLCELPCADWDLALVRHWLYDEAEALRWESVANSSLEQLRFLAARAQREERFHLDHAEMYLRRLAHSGAEGRSRINAGVASVLPTALGLWEPVAGEPEAISDGITAHSSPELAVLWRERVETKLAAWGYDWQWPTEGPNQQRRTQRSRHFAQLLTDLQEVITVDVDTAW